MTVRELIERLRLLDPDAPTLIAANGEIAGEVECVAPIDDEGDRDDEYPGAVIVGSLP